LNNNPQLFIYDFFSVLHKRKSFYFSFFLLFIMMDPVRDQRKSGQIMLPEQKTANSVLAEQIGGGDADNSPREVVSDGEPNKNDEGAEGSTPRAPSSAILGPLRRSPDFQMELMASGPPRHMLNTPQGPVEPETNLIVNYLPQTLSDDEFRLMFTNIGPIYSCRIMRDKRTGYSFGYGFVNYVNTQDARKAITTLNGKQIQNKQVKVALARPSGEDIKHANLYIKGIPKDMTRDQLADLFKPHGEIIQSKILVDQYTGTSKGAGFILFSKRSEADSAIQQLHDTKPAGLPDVISVKRAKDDAGEKSMVHHVIHHYQMPPGGVFPGSGPEMSAFPLGLLGGYPSAPSGPLMANPMNAFGARNSNFLPNQYSNNGASPRGPSTAVKLESQSPYNFVPSPYPAQISPIGSANSLDASFTKKFSSMTHGSYGSSYGSSGSSSSEANDNCLSEVLFVYNIGATDEKTLYTLFQPYGHIMKVNVIRDHGRGGLSKGFGFVTMESPAQAKIAMEHLNGYVLNGRSIQVSPKK